MADLTNVLKTELGVKDEGHAKHHHHHDKVIVPSKAVDVDVTHALQSQLGHGKEVDEEVQHEKSPTNKK
ncbi:unnamed protein product [Adineta ricciae]|uniref:Uncharacterized protein n=1 Tax=Adineta ricciae TaxID=249248 RepID=A0A814LVX9_ADIRI|nr:unnamed protein product [Adineta ricciae]